MRSFLLATAIFLWVCGSLALLAREVPEFPDHEIRKFSEIAERAAREILSQELFGHYDLVSLSVLSVEGLRKQLAGEPDYGLVKVMVNFSSKRNTRRHPSLHLDMFVSGSSMCRGWLYLHCGVPVGHVFEGKLQILLASDRNGEWRAVSPNWRSRREYSLDGYLVLDGRKKEGYVLFPAQ